MIKRGAILFVFFLSCSLFAFNTCAQQTDSTAIFVKELGKAKTEKEEYILLCKIAYRYRNSDEEAAISYYKRALDLAIKNNWNEGVVNIQKNIGKAYYNAGNADSSMLYLRKAYASYEKNEDVINIIEVTNDIGNTIVMGANYLEAISYFEKALALAQKENYYKGIADNNLSLGITYSQLGQKTKALGYIQNCLRTCDKYKVGDNLQLPYLLLGNLNDDMSQYKEAYKYYSIAEGLAEKDHNTEALLQIYTYQGNHHYKQKHYKEALEMYNKVLPIALKKNSLRIYAGAIGNLGNVYMDMGQLDSAEVYQKKSIVLFTKFNDVQGLIISLSNLGAIYFEKKQYKEALVAYNRSLELTKEINSLEDFIENYKGLSEIYAATKQFDKAYECERLYRIYNDSVFNESNTQKLTEMQMNYQFEMKEKEHAIIEQEKEKHQKVLNYAYAGGVLLLLLIIGVVYRSSLQRKKANLELAASNKEIEAKNEELNQQNEEILSQRDEIENQRNLLENKNTEITDSIFYARRIQRALLASEHYLINHCAEFFILNKPKDIVSGDFYWCSFFRNKLFVATADCTGHGVPGAFMSMIGVNFLNDIIIKNNILKPDDILNSLRKDIINALNPEGSTEESKDGMDMVLCVFDYEKMELEFAAANNPLWLVRNNELFEYKANKQPVGKYTDDLKPFTLQKIKIEKGDCVYTFSDGYADQFGGPKGKKLMYKPFKEILLANNSLPAVAQKENLEKHFMNWKGQLDQVDDVLVIGIKV